MILINIGLNIGDEQALDLLAVRRALKARGLRYAHSIRICQSDTEQTAVARLYEEPSADTIYNLAVALDQEAIAVYDSHRHKGWLEGPKKELWGEFNREFFKTFKDC